MLDECKNPGCEHPEIASFTDFYSMSFGKTLLSRFFRNSKRKTMSASLCAATGEWFVVWKDALGSCFHEHDHRSYKKDGAAFPCRGKRFNGIAF